MNKHIDKHLCWEWGKVGMMQGAGRGMVLAFGYLLLPILLAIVAFMWQVGVDLNALITGGESRLLTDPMAVVGMLFAGMFFSLFYVGFGMALGVFPATILGAVSGGIIGATLSLPHIAPHRWNRLAVGMGTALIIATVVNQVGGRLFWDQDGAGMYLFFIGVPSLVYLSFCAWLSDQLPTLVAKHQYIREFPVQDRLAATASAE